MSMFRSAAEISSSEADTDSDPGGHDEDNDAFNSSSHGVPVSSHLDKGKSPANLSTSVDSTSEVDASISREDVSTLAKDALTSNVERHANFMTAALLEFYCQTRAADILNAQTGSSTKFTRHSPEAQYLGKKLYKYKSQFLASHGVLADGIENEDLDGTRQSYRDNLDMLGLSALEDINLNDTQPPTPIEGSEELALISKLSQTHQGNHGPEKSVHFWKLPGEEAPFRTQISRKASFNVRQGVAFEAPRLPAPSRPLFGSSPVSLPIFEGPAMPPPYNNMSRYAVEFTELRMLGRGSFGEVYHVKNHIDGQDYAVKKIPLSQKRLDQLQYGGQNHLEVIMKEIRTLARLEHTNIVRYYGAWVEQAHVTGRGPIEHKVQGEHDSSNMDGSGLESVDDGMDIVFEHSENSAVYGHVSDSMPDESGFSDDITRWGSHTTLSTHRSKKSSRGGLEEDDEIESIPRHRSGLSMGDTSTFGETDDIFTDGMSQDQSRLQLQRRRRFGHQPPAVILHIQMSLHPISLSSYLNPNAAGNTNHTPGIPARRHCFHLMPSLRFMLDILAGVEYLHSKGIIHRDLKPANIFLCAPESATKAICTSCNSGTAPLTHFCRPRIGDFGLVADVSHLNEAASESAITPYRDGINVQPVVGTEFYRPPAIVEDSDLSGYFDEYQIDEKLDVYALGVIFFELLYRLNTRMERQMVLSDLTRRTTTLPDDFADKLDHCDTVLNTGHTVAETVTECIRGMLNPRSQHRWTLRQAREHIRPVYKVMKHSESARK
ncbi:Uncharacterized protein PECH_005435 [Penicillium ucsense]|uniref:Protein kinase domain-containing protein n=1 Tax=Penicillium ucsense TaxID=2839758 RepID=A0A8J8W2N6_9EURO|nr:Uncharacterized protein PECM_005974 [Penicillium ucsense]KAF7736334.1 Uncharacterized protein PECH_005435 [Penicillium ucsense]